MPLLAKGGSTSISDTKASQLASKEGLLTMPMSFFYSASSKRHALGFLLANRVQDSGDFL
jgi:hypothetical protein